MKHLHNGVPELHRQEFSYSAGLSDIVSAI